MALISRSGMLLAIIVVLAAPANGQQYDDSVAAGGPFSKVPIINTPFSAEAKTTMRQALADGTVREHTLTARYYRNSQGHVRAELDTPWGPYVILKAEIHTLDFDVRFVTLDPAKRTYRIGSGRFFAEELRDREPSFGRDRGRLRRDAHPTRRASRGSVRGADGLHTREGFSPRRPAAHTCHLAGVRACL